MKDTTPAKIAQPQSGELILSVPEKFRKLDELAIQYGGALSMADSPFSSTFTLASAMGQLRDLLTPDVMKPVMDLMNSPLGFLTDRSGKPGWKNGSQTPPKPLYTENEVRDVLIEATLRGFAMVGNETNIIAGRFYAAKAGLRRRVTTFPNLSEFKDIYEIPRNIGDKGAIVKCRASWVLNGKPDGMEREFAVKGDAFATSDAYSGKAERKLLNAVFQRLTGQSVPEGDATEEAAFERARDVTPRAVPVPNFPTEPEPEIKREKGGEVLNSEEPAPATGESGTAENTAPVTDIDGGNGPVELFEESAHEVPAEAVTVANPLQTLALALGQMKIGQGPFMLGLRKLNPEGVSRNWTQISQMPEEMARQILKDGLDTVLAAIRAKGVKL